MNATTTQTVPILMDGKLVDVEGRKIADGLAITPSTVKDFIGAVNGAVGRCYDCGPKFDGPSWSVRCTTCDWQWEDEFNEGPLDAKAAKDMARNHECEPEVELSPPGDSNEWFAEWLVKDDGQIGGAL